MMKRLLKIIFGVLLVLAIAIVGAHFYFAGGEDATELPQGKAPAQAQASASADSIQADLQRLLEQKNGEQLSAKFFRTIEDAQTCANDGKPEDGLKYIQNTKDFITEHMDEIKALGGVDMGIVEWFVSASADELLNSL